ncbi:hypothetical protein [Amycolatopsis albispora]|uniref:Uncharacterized protein n=1 Tax=Amycolatopsis albispora TaxID=1804986 RepID=A0A344LGW8_9PSEU|nr:hypothetical protein [Amycolatopsis albispora]AXB47292.1 hypothetical protein A4R43_36605 [Amycolatopsis albispora]
MSELQRDRECSREGCDRPCRAKDLCATHYTASYIKRRYHADPEFRRKRIAIITENKRRRRERQRRERGQQW